MMMRRKRRRRTTTIPGTRWVFACHNTLFKLCCVLDSALRCVPEHK